MAEPLIPEPALVRPATAGPMTALVPAAAHALTPAAPAGPEPIAQAVLRGLARRWRAAVGFGLLAAAVVGAAVWFVLPTPQPTATARILIPQNAQTVVGLQHPDQPLERQTQVAMVRSQLVLNAALNVKGVSTLPAVKEQSDPLDWLGKKLIVEFEGPEILRISLALDDPEQAKVLVNAVYDAFFQEVVNRSVADRQNRLRRLDDMAAQAEETLDRKRLALRNVSQGFAGADEKSLAHQQYLATQRLAAAQAANLKAHTKLQELKLEEVVLKGRIAGGGGDVSDAVLDKYVDEDERVRTAEAQLKLLEAKIAEYQKRASDVNSTEGGRLAFRSRDDQKQSLGKLRAQVRAEEKERFRTSSVADQTAKLKAVQQQIEFQQEMEKNSEEEVTLLAAEIRKMRDATLDLGPYQLAVKQAEDLHSRIRSAAVGLKLEQDAPPRVLDLERAVVSRVDPEKRRLMMSGGGALAALAVVVGLIGFAEYRLRRVDSPDAVSAGLGLRVIGTVPKRPLRWVPWGGGGNESDRWAAESISCTRTMLMHADGLAAHKVIQVTSPVSGEGKTTLSCQLAASVAGTGRRTLLVDADLRNPTAHLRFDLPNGPGLCEVLRGEASVHDVVKETHVPGLTLLPAGHWKDETAVALVSTELQGLFDVWRNQYDFVIVDSSPVLPVTDPLLLALHADGVLVSLMQGVSRMPLANEAYKRMTALGIRVLGAVVNGTPVRGYGYSAAYFPKA